MRKQADEEYCSVKSVRGGRWNAKKGRHSQTGINGLVL